MPPGPDWFSPWVQVCEIAWTAPQVIAYRTARMVRGGWPPSARDRREYVRMGREKVEVLAQAAMAAATSSPPVGAAVIGTTVAFVHRRVLANRRRLSRGW